MKCINELRRRCPVTRWPLYRIEWDRGSEVSILVQSFEQRPDWARAFSDLPVLARYQYKVYDPRFIANSWLAFRLRANNPDRVSSGRALSVTGTRRISLPGWRGKWLRLASKCIRAAIVGRERQATWKGTLDDRCVRMSHLGATFAGMLKVTDRACWRKPCGRASVPPRD